MTVTRLPEHSRGDAVHGRPAPVSGDGDPLHIADVCPYLAAEARDWRASGPHRDHRCTAVDPVAILALEKQRRLCLAPAHADCATFLAALDARPATSPASAEAGSASTRWRLARTASVVLDHGRVPLPPQDHALGRRAGQAALGGLMAAALAAVLVSRLQGGPIDDAPAAVASPEASASVLISSPSPRPAPTRAATPSPVPPPTPAPTPAVAATYSVRSGDTLYGIAARYGTTVAAIQALNGIDGSLLRIGQELRIPPPDQP